MTHPTIIGGLAALALVGAAIAANADTPNGATGFACGVSTVSDGGMLSIEGIVQSPTALNGDYRFALKSSGPGGNSNISQGGQFSAAANTAVSLGRVMVNANSQLDIDFTVSAGGQNWDCSEELAVRT